MNGLLEDHMGEEGSTADESFEAFVGRRHVDLVRFAYLLTRRDQATAEDLVQTVLLRVVRAGTWSRLDHPEAYLRRGIVNEWHTHLRSAGRADGRAEPPDVSVPDRTQQVADHDWVWSALAGLSEQQRTAVVLRYYVGATDQEIADVLGCSRPTVRSLVHRALPKVAAALTRTVEKAVMDVERQLREALAAAAHEVQEVRPLPHRRRRRALAYVAVAAALVVVGGISVARLVSGDGTGSGGGASCAYVVRWRGHDYTGIGEQRRLLEPGTRLGDGVLRGCDDGNGKTPDETIALYAAPGLDPTEAMVDESGEVLHDVGGELSPALRELREQVPCGLGAPENVRATPLGIAGDLPGPYRLDVAIDAGDGSPVDGYSRVVVTVRVGRRVPGAGDRGLVVERGLQEATPLRVGLACADGQYVATAISAVP